jgi:hypothetical protein
VYWVVVFVLVVVVVVLFQLCERVGGSEKAVKLVKFGFVLWLILVLSSAVWLINVIWEWRLNRGE